MALLLLSVLPIIVQDAKYPTQKKLDRNGLCQDHDCQIHQQLNSKEDATDGLLQPPQGPPSLPQLQSIPRNGTGSRRPLNRYPFGCFEHVDVDDRKDQAPLKAAPFQFAIPSVRL